ncbi:hypothetical protein KAS14_04850, partial [Candidatus Bathyarchaeota archaeon]|nr:hypothetical protein [Candidatus Bathyarchaeota archaeon]
CEFNKISKCFSATPLFICDKTKRKLLDDDTVYTRYNIYAITPKTLGNIVFLKMLPLVEAGPGGCYVNLDEKTIKKKRQELGLSVGKLAEMLEFLKDPSIATKWEWLRLQFLLLTSLSGSLESK